MELIDISLPITNQTLVWPGDSAVRINTSFPDHEGMTLSSLCLGAHTGTHIDAPLHFLPGGKPVERIPLDKLNGPCQVITIKSAAPEITVNDLAKHNILPGTRILFKTKNSQLYSSGKFHPDYTALSPAAARFLADRNIALVGIDYLSIEPYNNPGFPVHKTLLTKEIVILEGLNLDQVVKGEYELICLPLNLHGVEGAPCRAILKSV